MEPKINYVALLILIILGVAVGNLASSFITAKYSYKEHKKQAAEEPVALPATIPATAPASIPKPKVSKNIETPQETIKLSPKPRSEFDIDPELTEKPTNTKQLIEQRKLDENGIRLAKICNEWTVVHKDMNTPSSERGMNKHCSEYYDYLSFGNAPEVN